MGKKYPFGNAFLFLSCYFNRERRVLNKWPFHWSTANSGSNYNIFTPTAHHNGRLYSVSTAEHQIFQLKKYLTRHLWWLSSYARFNFLSLRDLKATYVDGTAKKKKKKVMRNSVIHLSHLIQILNKTFVKLFPNTFHLLGFKPFSAITENSLRLIFIYIELDHNNIQKFILRHLII